ncbi:uncharacterized protein LOC110621964 isoform X2 [Manihot esculenta]|uniref:uncharacterized protein LOC110621964 isoform X2 n=1 Tax=Manihot esculenta TaxID=3983 RepID=UPI000B5D0ACE|nr:uncharacterized protein LOC110621964 isoform X2 [Manihot esculenta]
MVVVDTKIFACSFLGLLRKWGFGDRDKVKNASDDNGFNKTVQQDSFRRINNVCMQMMQQLCLSHDKQVHTQVKIVADAKLGAGATEARELEANWVILDRVVHCLRGR